ncbi:hypothetical protein N7499_012037 [Penicillium canescens]|uniref:mRNA stability protein n=1 Tax=Penicillium canescens TaxID=5083 RepID=A0AAD6IMR1_PENCN|nr:uncharacterized protein N7446_007312 [Penicillium canescens]KAJ5991385.1 hypothetical protein N7522_011592 [Penicillium canescens]KAJ6052670.1 hypothetical protein N7460_003204 [Penicillium canescens]KAJ6063192.1 hypothetical protein N7446_007312 [Penicillium canescens]KAJ6070150.1 hypothetical protein N7499_012037 [Penicillium canescens]KAJ6181799.1 hypothetical protein N7485_000441 [Penicillium canescens]
MQSGGKEPYPEPLSESEKRHLSKYRKRPRGGLLGQKSKERTYFDSGDFALSAAHRVTDLGAIQTGRAHPHRENISRPSPIPAASNVDKKVKENLHRRDASSQKNPLHRQTNEDSFVEGQDNIFSFED